jgi:hypothetical protein
MGYWVVWVMATLEVRSMIKLRGEAIR